VTTVQQAGSHPRQATNSCKWTWKWPKIRVSQNRKRRWLFSTTAVYSY